jgi:GNAT superfamily N-acetyltransferase
MMTTRMATAVDAELIARHRVRMFVDSGQADGDAMTQMAANFVAWVRPRLEDGRYLGWLVVEGDAVVAGAGMWLIDFPPHWMDAEPVRAYLLNFYVEPAFRGQGIAEQMLKLVVDEAKQRGIGVVSLHASKLGRPIYERNGFSETNEMMLRIA